MKELGITEDMVYGDLITGKSDSYERSSGKKLWTGRYQGGRKKIAMRERENSSSSHYDKEPSRNLSSCYKTHVVSHVDIASSSVGGTSLPRISTETENNEYQEHPSSNTCVMRSGDTQKKPSSQTSDSNSQGIEREGSTSMSLSQASQGTTDSVRQLTSGDSYINSQLHARKQYESENDDSVFKEKEKLNNYGLKRKRQLVDRRSRGSPKKRASDYSDDEKPKKDQKYPSRSDSVSFCQSPLQAEANNKVNAAAQVDEMVNQIHSMDLENFPEVPGPELVKQEPLHRIDLDYDQVESQVNAQLDAHQTEPEIQSSCASMSCTPPISAFDFERDETPPAEIVEATAEWCRTQNFPADFSSVSLQHVFQYYQSSMAVDGTKDKNECGLWHSPIWPGIYQQRDQPLGQSLGATSSDVTNPACSSQSAFYASLQNVSPTTECSSNASNVRVHAHFSAYSKPVTKSSEQANLATVQHGVPTCSYSACEPRSSHLNNAMDGDTHQLSDGEIQEHLKMFLNKQDAEAIEHSFDCELMPTSGALTGVETTSDVTGCIGLKQANHTVRHCSQQGKEASSSTNFDLISPCHSRDQNIFTIPENQEKSYLMSNINHSGMQQGGNQRLSQHLSSQSYPLNEHIHVHKGSRDYKQALTHDCLSTLSYAATMDSVEETTACIDFHHKYDQKGNEPAMSRNQWKEGEHKLSRNRQHTSKGLWRAEELGYVQEPLRREKADNSLETAPCIVHVGRPLDSSLATRGELHNGDPSSSTFSSQTSLDSVYQASSVTASQACNEISCIHEGVVRGSQLRNLNKPTARESYRYHSPSRDHYKQASQVDLASSPFSGYQHADVDELRVSSPDFHRRRQQRLNTEGGDILPNRSLSKLKVKSMCTPLQELSKLDINPVSRDENEPDKCELCVPQRVLNEPNKDQRQRLLREELAATDIDMDDDAEEVSSTKLVLDKHKSTCTEKSLGMGMSDDTEVDALVSGADVQALQSKKRKLVADKYKHLQKYYYKVNTCNKT